MRASAAGIAASDGGGAAATDRAGAQRPDADAPVSGAPRRGPGLLSPMVVRVLSAAVLIAAILGGLASGFAASAVVLTALIMVGTVEFYLITRRLGAPAAPWVLFPLTLALLFRFQLSALGAWVVPLAVTLAVFAGLSAYVFSPRPVDGMTRWAYGVAGALYLGWSLGFYYALLNMRSPDPGHVGLGWIAALAGCAIFGDTAALLVGSRLGRHRFFPQISPQKSIEGAVGGFLAGTLFFAAFTQLLDLPLIHGLVLGALLSVAAQAGDLVESQLKRAAGLKDASNLVPGHGGMLDRIDSLVMLAGVAYYYLALVLHTRLPQ
ncbi:MAG TPA: phosphatidate cytidylyltransferase [Candidatus Dormibacteraeota bacterium]|nr:phosphatidate cytidylyltransferase [Candidatus Dormibacteraeota bacterium]